MAFKSEKQRRFVMMKLNEGRFIPKGTPKNIITSSNNTLKKKGIRLAPNKDIDKDGVKNSKDCQPLNKQQQGAKHKVIKQLKTVNMDNLTKPQKQKLKKAINDLQKATTKDKLKLWDKKWGAKLGFLGLAALSLATPVAALVTPIALVVSLVTPKGFNIESDKARKILKQKRQIIKSLEEQGFTKSQANNLIKAKILKLEKRADNRISNELKKDKIREKKRINKLLK